MRIKLTEENRNRIETALKNVNGTAKTHTFTDFEEVEAAKNKVEVELENLGLPVSYRKGAQAEVHSLVCLPNSHSGAKGTIVTLRRGRDSWFVTDVGSRFVSGKANGRARRITLTSEQTAAIGRNHAKNVVKGSVYFGPGVSETEKLQN